MNKLQISFGDNNFVEWYNNLSKKEQKEVLEEMHKHMEQSLEKYLQTLPEVKNVKLGKPKIFRKEE